MEEYSRGNGNGARRQQGGGPAGSRRMSAAASESRNMAYERNAGNGSRGMATGSRNAGGGSRGMATGSRNAGGGSRGMVTGSRNAGGGSRGMATGSRNAGDGSRGMATGSRNAGDGSRGMATGGRNPEAGQPGAARPSGDRQARARAMARRKRRRRQRRIIIGSLIFLLILIAAGIIFGVSSYKKGKIRQTLLKEGIASMESERYEEAIGKFDEILAGSKGKVGSFEVEVLTYRGEAEYKQKDYSAALNTFELLLKEDGEKERYQRMICYSQLELGNYEEALAYGFADAKAYNGMTLRDIQNEQYDAALENVQKGIAACEAGDPVMQELAYSQAVIYEKKEDFVKALELFESYLAAYGSDEKVEREVTFLKTRQGGGSQQGGDGTQQSGDGTQQSGDGTQQSGDGTQQSGDGTQQSDEGAQPSETQTQQAETAA